MIDGLDGRAPASVFVRKKVGDTERGAIQFQGELREAGLWTKSRMENVELMTMQVPDLQNGGEVLKGPEWIKRLWALC